MSSTSTRLLPWNRSSRSVASAAGFIKSPSSPHQAYGARAGGCRTGDLIPARLQYLGSFSGESGRPTLAVMLYEHTNAGARTCHQNAFVKPIGDNHESGAL